jgi:GDP-D-mannose dehydratase
MIEFDEPQDFVIATGQVGTLEEFVSLCHLRVVATVKVGRARSFRVPTER